MFVKRINPLLFVTIAVLSSFFIVPPSQTASANAWASASTMQLIKSSCRTDPGQYQELSQLKNEIIAADTLTRARTIALAPTNDAVNALKNARRIMPFSDDLRSAETRLHEARSHILVASSQEQVADVFDGMMLAGLDDDRLAKASAGEKSCDYSTGETIAIVIGLILGIIPGLILLALLC